MGIFDNQDEGFFAKSRTKSFFQQDEDEEDKQPTSPLMGPPTSALPKAQPFMKAPQKQGLLISQAYEEYLQSLRDRLRPTEYDSLTDQDYKNLGQLRTQEIKSGALEWLEGKSPRETGSPFQNQYFQLFQDDKGDIYGESSSWLPVDDLVEQKKNGIWGAVSSKKFNREARKAALRLENPKLSDRDLDYRLDVEEIKISEEDFNEAVWHRKVKSLGFDDNSADVIRQYLLGRNEIARKKAEETYAKVMQDFTPFSVTGFTGTEEERQKELAAVRKKIADIQVELGRTVSGRLAESLVEARILEILAARGKQSRTTPKPVSTTSGIDLRGNASQAERDKAEAREEAKRQLAAEDRLRNQKISELKLRLTALQDSRLLTYEKLAAKINEQLSQTGVKVSADQVKRHVPLPKDGKLSVNADIMAKLAKEAVDSSTRLETPTYNTEALFSERRVVSKDNKLLANVKGDINLYYASAAMKLYQKKNNGKIPTLDELSDETERIKRAADEALIERRMYETVRKQDIANRTKELDARYTKFLKGKGLPDEAIADMSTNDKLKRAESLGYVERNWLTQVVSTMYGIIPTNNIEAIYLDEATEGSSAVMDPEFRKFAHKLGFVEEGLSPDPSVGYFKGDDETAQMLRGIFNPIRESSIRMGAETDMKLTQDYRYGGNTWLKSLGELERYAAYPSNWVAKQIGEYTGLDVPDYDLRRDETLEALAKSGLTDQFLRETVGQVAPAFIPYLGPAWILANTWYGTYGLPTHMRLAHLGIAGASMGLGKLGAKMVRKGPTDNVTAAGVGTFPRIQRMFLGGRVTDSALSSTVGYGMMATGGIGGGVASNLLNLDSFYNEDQELLWGQLALGTAMDGLSFVGLDLAMTKAAKSKAPNLQFIPGTMVREEGTGQVWVKVRHPMDGDLRTIRIDEEQTQNLLKEHPQETVGEISGAELQLHKNMEDGFRSNVGRALYGPEDPDMFYGKVGEENIGRIQSFKKSIGNLIAAARGSVGDVVGGFGGEGLMGMTREATMVENLAYIRVDGRNIRTFNHEEIMDDTIVPNMVSDPMQVSSRRANYLRVLYEGVRNIFTESGDQTFVHTLRKLLRDGDIKVDENGRISLTEQGTQAYKDIEAQRLKVQTDVEDGSEARKQAIADLEAFREDNDTNLNDVDLILKQALGEESEPSLADDGTEAGVAEARQLEKNRTSLTSFLRRLSSSVAEKPTLQNLYDAFVTGVGSFSFLSVDNFALLTSSQQRAVLQLVEKGALQYNKRKKGFVSTEFSLSDNGVRHQFDNTGRGLLTKVLYDIGRIRASDKESDKAGVEELISSFKYAADLASGKGRDEMSLADIVNEADRIYSEAQASGENIKFKAKNLEPGQDVVNYVKVPHLKKDKNKFWLQMEQPPAPKIPVSSLITPEMAGVADHNFQVALEGIGFEGKRTKNKDGSVTVTYTGSDGLVGPEGPEVGVKELLSMAKLDKESRRMLAKLAREDSESYLILAEVRIGKNGELSVEGTVQGKTSAAGQQLRFSGALKTTTANSLGRPMVGNPAKDSARVQSSLPLHRKLESSFDFTGWAPESGELPKEFSAKLPNGQLVHLVKDTSSNSWVSRDGTVKMTDDALKTRLTQDGWLVGTLKESELMYSRIWEPDSVMRSSLTEEEMIRYGRYLLSEDQQSVNAESMSRGDGVVWLDKDTSVTIGRDTQWESGANLFYTRGSGGSPLFWLNSKLWDVYMDISESSAGREAKGVYETHFGMSLSKKDLAEVSEFMQSSEAQIVLKSEYRLTDEEISTLKALMSEAAATADSESVVFMQLSQDRLGAAADNQLSVTAGSKMYDVLRHELIHKSLRDYLVSVGGNVEILKSEKMRETMAALRDDEEVSKFLDELGSGVTKDGNMGHYATMAALFLTDQSRYYDLAQEILAHASNYKTLRSGLGLSQSAINGYNKLLFGVVKGLAQADTSEDGAVLTTLRAYADPAIAAKVEKIQNAKRNQTIDELELSGLYGGADVELTRTGSTAANLAALGGDGRRLVTEIRDRARNRLEYNILRNSENRDQTSKILEQQGVGVFYRDANKLSSMSDVDAADRHMMFNFEQVSANNRAHIAQKGILKLTNGLSIDLDTNRMFEVDSDPNYLTDSVVGTSFANTRMVQMLDDFGPMGGVSSVSNPARAAQTSSIGASTYHNRELMLRNRAAILTHNVKHNTSLYRDYKSDVDALVTFLEEQGNMSISSLAAPISQARLDFLATTSDPFMVLKYSPEVNYPTLRAVMFHEKIHESIYNVMGPQFADFMVRNQASILFDPKFRPVYDRIFNAPDIAPGVSSLYKGANLDTIFHEVLAFSSDIDTINSLGFDRENLSDLVLVSEVVARIIEDINTLKSPEAAAQVARLMDPKMRVLIDTIYGDSYPFTEMIASRRSTGFKNEPGVLYSMEAFPKDEQASLDLAIRTQDAFERARGLTRLYEDRDRAEAPRRAILINGRMSDTADLPKGVKDTIAQLDSSPVSTEALRQTIIGKYTGLAELAEITTEGIRSQIDAPAEYSSTSSTRNVYFNRPYRGQVVEITKGPDAGKFILETTNDASVKDLNGREVASVQEGLNLIANSVLSESEGNLNRYREAIDWAKGDFEITELFDPKVLTDAMLRPDRNPPGTRGTPLFALDVDTARNISKIADIVKTMDQFPAELDLNVPENAAFMSLMRGRLVGDYEGLVRKHAFSPTFVSYQQAERVLGPAFDRAIRNNPEFEEAAKRAYAKYALTDKPTQPLFAVDADVPVIDGFYSPLQKAVSAERLEKASGKDWLNRLSATPGIKAAELQWTALENFLAVNADNTVSKQDIADWLKNHRVTVNVDVDEGKKTAWSKTKSLWRKGKVDKFLEFVVTVPSLVPGDTAGKLGPAKTVIVNEDHYFVDNNVLHARATIRTDKKSNQQYLDLEEDQSDFAQSKRQGKIAESMPFEKNWQELGLKVVVDYALKNGIRTVKWTSGAEQINRNSAPGRFMTKEIKYSFADAQTKKEFSAEIAKAEADLAAAKKKLHKIAGPLDEILEKAESRYETLVERQVSLEKKASRTKEEEAELKSVKSQISEAYFAYKRAESDLNEQWFGGKFWAPIKEYKDFTNLQGVVKGLKLKGKEFNEADGKVRIQAVSADGARKFDKFINLEGPTESSSIDFDGVSSLSALVGPEIAAQIKGSGSVSGVAKGNLSIGGGFHKRLYDAQLPAIFKKLYGVAPELDTKTNTWSGTIPTEVAQRITTEGQPLFSMDAIVASETTDPRTRLAAKKIHSELETIERNPNFANRNFIRLLDARFGDNQLSKELAAFSLKAAEKEYGPALDILLRVLPDSEEVFRGHYLEFVAASKERKVLEEYQKSLRDTEADERLERAQVLAQDRAQKRKESGMLYAMDADSLINSKAVDVFPVNLVNEHGFRYGVESFLNGFDARTGRPIRKKLPSAALAKDWASMFKNHFTADELTWTGDIMEWLNSAPNTKLTKDELLRYAAENRVTMGVTMFGNLQRKKTDLDILRNVWNTQHDDWKKAYRNLPKKEFGNTAQAALTLGQLKAWDLDTPENRAAVAKYEEVGERMKNIKSAIKQLSDEILSSGTQYESVAKKLYDGPYANYREVVFNYEAGYRGRVHSRFTEDDLPIYHKLVKDSFTGNWAVARQVTPGKHRYESALFPTKEEAIAAYMEKNVPSFTDPNHFPGKNPMWYRAADVPLDPTTNKFNATMLHEIQSPVHQSGESRGYVMDDVYKELQTRKQAADESYAELYEAYTERSDFMDTAESDQILYKSDFESAAKLYKKVRDVVDELVPLRASGRLMTYQDALQSLIADQTFAKVLSKSIVNSAIMQDIPGFLLWGAKVTDALDRYGVAKTQLASIRSDIGRFQSDETAPMPQVPFSKIWHKVLFKKALTDAVEKGHEMLLWPTGSEVTRVNESIFRESNLDRIEVHKPVYADTKDAVATYEGMLKEFTNNRKLTPQQLADLNTRMYDFRTKQAEAIKNGISYRQELLDKIQDLQTKISEKNQMVEMLEDTNADFNQIVAARNSVYVMKREMSSLKGQLTKLVNNEVISETIDPSKQTVVIKGYRGDDVIVTHTVPINGRVSRWGFEIGLNSLLGQNMAKQVRGERQMVSVFEGENLSIGGEFFDNLYNNKLRKVAEEIGNQFGVAPTKIPIQTKDGTETIKHNLWELSYADVEAYKQDLKDGYTLTVEYPADSGKASVQVTSVKQLLKLQTDGEAETLVVQAPARTADFWALPINEAMKESVVNSGQPLFSMESDAKSRESLEIFRQAARYNEIIAKSSEDLTQADIRYVLEKGHAAIVSTYDDSLPADVNAARLQELAADLERAGLASIKEVDGRYTMQNPDGTKGNQVAEKALIIIARTEASFPIIEHLMAKHNQQSIITASEGVYKMVFFDNQMVKETVGIEFGNKSVQGTVPDGTYLTTADGPLSFSIGFPDKDGQGGRIYSRQETGESAEIIAAYLDANERFQDSELTLLSDQADMQREGRVTDLAGKPLENGYLVDMFGEVVGKVVNETRDMGPRQEWEKKLAPIKARYEAAKAKLKSDEDVAAMEGAERLRYEEILREFKSAEDSFYRHHDYIPPKNGVAREWVLLPSAREKYPEFYREVDGVVQPNKMDRDGRVFVGERYDLSPLKEGEKPPPQEWSSEMFTEVIDGRLGGLPNRLAMYRLQNTVRSINEMRGIEMPVMPKRPSWGASKEERAQYERDMAVYQAQSQALVLNYGKQTFKKYLTMEREGALTFYDEDMRKWYDGMAKIIGRDPSALFELMNAWALAATSGKTSVGDNANYGMNLILQILAVSNETIDRVKLPLLMRSINDGEFIYTKGTRFKAPAPKQFGTNTPELLKFVMLMKGYRQAHDGDNKKAALPISKILTMTDAEKTEGGVATKLVEDFSLADAEIPESLSKGKWVKDEELAQLIQDRGEVAGIMEYLIRFNQNNLQNAQVIMGPKIGAFFLNLAGFQAPVTIDVWMGRWFRTLMGEQMFRDSGGRMMESEEVRMSESYLFQGMTDKIAADLSKELGRTVEPRDVQQALWLDMMNSVYPYQIASARRMEANTFFTNFEPSKKVSLGSSEGKFPTGRTGEAMFDPEELSPLLQAFSEGEIQKADLYRYLKGTQGLMEFRKMYKSASIKEYSTIKEKPRGGEKYADPRTLRTAVGLYSMESESLNAQQSIINLSEPLLQQSDSEAWIGIAERLVAGNTAVGRGMGRLADTEKETIKALAEKQDLEGLQKYVLGLNKQTVLELLVNVSRVALLIGYKNVVKNIGGNSLRQLMDEVTRVPASVLDTVLIQANRAMGGANFDRSVTSIMTNPVRTIQAYATALGKAGTEGMGDFVDVLRGIDENVIFEHPSLFRERTTGWKFLKPLEIFEKYGWRFQGAMDKPFNVGAYYRTLHELQKFRHSEQIKEGNDISFTDAEQFLTPGDHELAEQYALMATYQKKNVIADKYYGIIDGLPPTWRALISNVVKFVKTPLNVADYILDFTGFWPLAKLAHKEFNTTDWVDWKRSVKKVLDTPQDRKTISMALSQGAIGTVMFHIGYRMAEGGLISAFYSREDRKEQEQMEAKGTSWGKVNIGGYSIDISWLSPNSYWLVSGATAFEASNDWERKKTEFEAELAKAQEENNEARIASVNEELVKHNKKNPTDETVTRLIKNFALQTPFLRQIDDVVTAWNSNNMFKTLGGLWVTPEAYVPAIVKEVAEATDDYERVVTDESFSAKAMDKIQRNIPTIPGVSDIGQKLAETGTFGVEQIGRALTGRRNLPVKYDMFGRPVNAPSPKFGPFRGVPMADDVLTKEMDRFNLSITKPEGGTVVNENQLRKQKGDIFRPVLESVVNSPQYSEVNDEFKKRMLEYAMRNLTNEMKVDKRSADEEKFNLDMMLNREKFKYQLKSSPEQFIKPRTIKDKEILRIFVGAGLDPTVDMQSLINDIRKGGLDKFIDDKFMFDLMITDKRGQSDTEVNYQEFMADPQLALVRWWASDRRANESRERVKARREQLLKEGKSKEEIEKIIRKEAARRGAQTRIKLRRFGAIEVQ